MFNRYGPRENMNTRRAIFLAEDQDRRLSNIATSRHLSISAIVREAIDEYLAERGGHVREKPTTKA